MNQELIDIAIRLQSLAQAGLAYGHNEFDIERYEEIREIAASIIANESRLQIDDVKGFFTNETGYQTPKIDTRAAIFKDDQILLVREKTGKWALPGGWCEVDESIASNTEKEAYEEAGIKVAAEKLIAIQDWRKHNVQNLPYGITKIFIQCESHGGDFEENIETIERGFFNQSDIPENLADEKTSKAQIDLCFEAYHAGDDWQTPFD